MVRFENPALTLEWEFEEGRGFLNLTDNWLVCGDILINCDIEATCNEKYYPGDYYCEPSSEITGVDVEVANLIAYDNEGSRIYPFNLNQIEAEIKKFIKSELQ